MSMIIKKYVLAFLVLMLILVSLGCCEQQPLAFTSPPPANNMSDELTIVRYMREPICANTDHDLYHITLSDGSYFVGGIRNYDKRPVFNRPVESITIKPNKGWFICNKNWVIIKYK